MLITKPVRLVVKPVSVPDTRLTESAQCVYLAARQFARKPIDSDAVKRTMIRTQSRVAVDISTTDIVDKLSPTWQRSSEKIANQLGTYLTRTDYTFHRNSATVKQIYLKFSELNKKEGKIFDHSDKWQPADIWAIAGKVDVSRVKTIDQLNRYLKDKLAAGLIVPISLKQSVGLKPVTIERMNASDSVNVRNTETLPKIAGLQVNTGNQTWMSSKMVKINFKLEGNKSGWFELRQSKPGADVGLETVIRTSAARHGKLNKSVLIQAIRHAGGTVKIPDEKKINKMSIDNNQELIEACYNLAMSLDKQSSVTPDQFTEMLHQKKDRNWLASKYIGMLYIESIGKLSTDKQTQIVAELYSHGLVVGELAAPFLKVQ